MDWIVWLVVIIVVVAVVWWLLNRNKSRAGADSGSAAGTGAASGTAASPTAAAGSAAVAGSTAAAGSAAAMAAPAAAQAPGPEVAPEAAVTGPSAPATASEPTAEPATEAAGTPENAEWETQWSETAPPSDAHAAPAHVDPTRGAHVAAGAEPGAVAEPAPAEGLPVHHPEYTEPHAPTLPGAESAAAEPAEDEDAGTGPGTAEASASHMAEPTGHLATEQPYGEGSAAPAADGSGPEGFTVKGNASSMIYHEETSPSYEETRAEVWFLSAAHAEAAGFRPPRRTRQ
ncbi:hypothetical protein ACFVTM_16420 [Arthrobacter sp. NPDC058130]|uniref:sunset domain-containing protein n=1 Tax=Arthrobacter sp. NPDC058130 TaxID=3346353 RepID=UPI0036EFCD44